MPEPEIIGQKSRPSDSGADLTIAGARDGEFIEPARLRLGGGVGRPELWLLMGSFNARTFVPKEIRGAEDIVSEGANKKNEVKRASLVLKSVNFFCYV